MLVFEKAIIKRYWPGEEKNDQNESVRLVVLQIEVDLDNSNQVGELFNCMVRGLVEIAFMDTLTGEEYILPAITIKPFNVKQRTVKIGKGEDVESVKTEYAALTLTGRLKDEQGSQVLADLYRFFNIPLQMTIADFKWEQSEKV